ncbi:hypothetical protein MJO29_007051 [Puccinia striiformis f. sp. tritici]|uniref:TM7S3/TM198-like domain-containing protein n=3 Tax=Puccinia striiformis TaxID=27350 RepID=A0A0L0VRU4_9BASI|nr:hypothetical protein Pst134EA_013200 [Puccinia striiformis f. sp. tritici]KAI9622765.1 hypothetical protein H4Q26_015048 [Puccinia striiformis f. sp. tritici PST-130]KNF01979.1 hypothetical protein PSTG_04803 [Puccinia striiformis f. sp. tritici PST-78]POW08941.1 hypothetical protein PSHT_09332 [Puccinia striiformis]KAH9465310.1 hypothetical protein Pst134EA_013200 [Puccinia striiformis f. sp. tritici]KAI7955652.1 hypothetical protein MJO29_007051 [Puccinia striiformis f. sp. tritici]
MLIQIRPFFLNKLLVICAVCLINGLVSPQANAQAIDTQSDNTNPPQEIPVPPPAQHQTQPALNDPRPLAGNSSASNGTFRHDNSTQSASKNQEPGKNNEASSKLNNTTTSNSLVDTKNEHINNLAEFNSSEVPLHTKITVPFSILGVILIVSGAPMCFWGGRNRWSSYFLTGAYVAALIVMIPILRFGVIEKEHSPSDVVQGIFVLVCFVSAVGAGAMGVIFWKGTRFIVGAGGGFVISLFILSLHSNSLINPIGLRWILILGCIALGFVLATIPVLTIHVTLFATAAMGAAAVVLGIDCFTAGGLKEFWLYNVGFEALFPHLNYFPFTVIIQAELGVMGAIFVMGAAIQWRLLEIIMKKINELKQIDQDRELEEEAAAYRQSMLLDADLALWEKRHGDDDDKTTAKRTVDTPNSPITSDSRRPISKTYSQRPSSKAYSHRQSSRLSYELVPRLSDPFAPAPPQSHYSPVARGESYDGLPPIDVGSHLQV